MGDAFLAIAVIIGSLIYLYADHGLQNLNLGDPVGPGIFPAIIGIGLLMSGLVLFIETLKKRRVGEVHQSADKKEGDHRLILLGAAAWTIVYYAAFEPVGYLLSTIIYIFALLAYFHRGKWKSNAAIALGFALGAEVVFSYFLGVSLPSGPFAFL